MFKHFLGCLCVEGKGGLDAAVAHAFLADLGIQAGCNEGGRVGVSRIVERHASKVCLPDSWREVALEV